MISLSLVIPSYRRPASLEAALRAALAQEVPFEEIIVVARADDRDTHDVATHAGVHLVTVDEPGVIAAMLTGARHATSDIIGFCDDDARVSSEWSRRVRSLFEDPRNAWVGGVGGRDLLFDGDVPRTTTLTNDVGRLTVVGRVVGNHHRGIGGPRDVDVLKGVNCAYRRVALAFPQGLRGDGAQAHFEVAIGQHCRQNSWRLIYDPSLKVEHRPDDRVGADHRTAPRPNAIADSAFNLERSLPTTRATRRWLYVHLVGDGACPGLLRCAVALVRRDRAVLQRRAPSWRGTTDAWRQRRHPLRFIAVDEESPSSPAPTDR